MLVSDTSGGSRVFSSLSVLYTLSLHDALPILLPSWTKSSTPVTVTVWLPFQFAGVKVKAVVLAVPSAVLLDDTGMTTIGRAYDCSRTTWHAVTPAASGVVKPVVGLTM